MTSLPEKKSANLSLHAAHVLRARVAAVAKRSHRKGRPRERFLEERRSQTATILVQILAVLAAVSGAIAGLTLATEGRELAAAAIVQACIAILLGAAALCVPMVRKSPNALLALACGAIGGASLGWGLAAHFSGGASSPWILAIPTVVMSSVGVIPLPPRIAAVLSAIGYLSLLVASPMCPAWAHLLVAVVAVGAWWTARGRHRRAIATFLKIERLTVNVRRMRKMHDQLVLVEKLEALRVLVGGMAHELNNALAVAMASTQQAAKMAPFNPEQTTSAIRRAEGGLGRIRQTVEKLRRFAMASEGVLEPADVAAMLDFALESAIGRARSGVKVERQYDPGVGSVACHVGALAECLYQVARNAIESMPAGGTIRAIVRDEGDKVSLTVQDEGKGISEDVIKHIFDPYWRNTVAAKRAGMGLAAVYGIVTSLGGSLRVQSGEGRGTSVSILLPRRGGSQPDALRPA